MVFLETAIQRILASMPLAKHDPLVFAVNVQALDLLCWLSSHICVLTEGWFVNTVMCLGVVFIICLAIFWFWHWQKALRADFELSSKTCRWDKPL